MGWLDIFTGAAGGVLGSAVDFGFQALANETLGISKAQREMNEYNAAEAQKARDFSAQEAEINRDWQEEMYSKYNSLHGKMQQAREAGVNPMLAVTGSATSPMSTSPAQPAAPAASGSSASPVGQISDMVGAALGFCKLQSEIKNIQAQTRSMNARALVDELNATWIDKLNSQTIAESVKRIEVADVDMSVKSAQIKELTSRALDLEASAQERTANVSRIVEDTLRISADKNYKLESINLVRAQVASSQQDVKVKSAQILLIGAQTRSEIKRESLITQQTVSEMIGQDLAQDERKKIGAEINKLNQEFDILVQEFGHKEVINALNQYLLQADTYSFENYIPSNKIDGFCHHFLTWLTKLFSGVLAIK